MSECHALGSVLVLGGAGWVGSALVRALAERHEELGITGIVAADAATRGAGRWHCGSLAVDEVHVDVACDDDLRSCIAHASPDLLVNLAAVIDIRPEADALRMEAVNATAVVSMLEAARQVGVHAFVHVSTLDVAYSHQPMVNHAPHPPEDLQLDSPIAYVRSKARAEAFALGTHGDTGLPSVVVLRPAHVFGEVGDPLMGFLQRKPPLVFGSPSTLMSMTSVPTLVDVIIGIAQRAPQFAGQCLAVKDFDENFMVLYHERLLHRRILLTLPSWCGLLLAHVADLWVAFGIAAALAVQRLPLGHLRATQIWQQGCVPLWTRLWGRHPMLNCCLNGIRQSVEELTVDDFATRSALGDYGRRAPTRRSSC